METSPLLAPSPCLVSPLWGAICLVFFPLLGGGLLSGLYGFGCYMELPCSKSSLQPGLGWQQSGSTKRLHRGTSSKGATRRGCCLLQRGIANPSRVQTSSKREKKFFFFLQTSAGSRRMPAASQRRYLQGTQTQQASAASGLLPPPHWWQQLPSPSRGPSTPGPSTPGCQHPT